jgi:hypothetical protein
MPKQITNEKPFSGKIDAQITITASYDDLIIITVYDKHAGNSLLMLQ